MLKNQMKKVIALTTCGALVIGSTVGVAATELNYNSQDSSPAVGVETVQSDETQASVTDEAVNPDADKEGVEQPGETAPEGDENLDTDGENDGDEGEAVEPEEPAFSQFKDAENHWGRDALEKAFNDGILMGYEDGTMRPDDKITGAQMVSILTRVLKTNEKTDISASGLSEDSWYAEAAAKAVSLGIIKYENIGSLNGKMVRKDAFKMMSDAFQLEKAEPDMTKASTYTDFLELDKSGKIAIASLVNDGYILGWEDSLMLSNEITRAEFVSILYRVVEKHSSMEDEKNIPEIEASTVLSGKDINISTKEIDKNIWTDGNTAKISISNSELKSLVLRSDKLESLSIKNSKIDRLVVAANGSLSMNTKGINSLVIGDGSGAVSLDGGDGNIEVIGNSRSVAIAGHKGKVLISGDGNEITVKSSSDVKDLNIYGSNNKITIESDVENVILSGKNNKLNGTGKVTNAENHSKTSVIGVDAENLLDKIDKGIEGLTVAISAPQEVTPGTSMQASATFSNVPENKRVTVEWTIDGNVVKSEKVNLVPGYTTSVSQYFGYDPNMASAITVNCTVKHVTEDDDAQSISAAPAVVKIDTHSAAFYQSIVDRIFTKYSGNRTTQWAIDHDFTPFEKEVFVNTKGYSSPSKYLVWVNIGTQHTNIFEGSKGKWKLIRSGLVSTGAGDCTPRGVFKTTYKQTNWTTSSYTVKPVVRFYGGGYAFHSRLYKPGTTTLKGGNNGVGYPLSHGCVRMQADDIEWMYANVPNGTTVVVY